MNKNKKGEIKMATKKHTMVKKNVIVRANVAGVHAGTVESVSGDTVILVNARRLWRVYTRDKSGSISDVAANGLKPDAQHNIGAVLKRVCIVNPAGFEISEMTNDAHKSVMSYPVA